VTDDEWQEKWDALNSELVTCHTSLVTQMEIIVETEIICTHCGEVFPLQIDTSQTEQTLIEDCTVCCRPISLTIRCEPGEVVDLVCEA
jgi:hypothetical protein